tara:strand:- start:10312 stop:10938 length:627 start_codon:yes stop_codon:yes gene_type:complete
MMKLFRSILLILLGGILSAQDWEAVLVSGDTARGLSFTEIQGEVLLAIQKEKPASYIQTFDIEKINELRFLKKKKVRVPWKTRLTGMAGGSVIGYGAGYMMGNIILWWLSYEELGSLKLFGPRPEDLNSGQQLITNIALNMVTVIGLLKGYDWKMEIIDDVTTYRLADLSVDERKDVVQGTIWPEQPSRIKELFKKAVAMAKLKIGRQ